MGLLEGVPPENGAYAVDLNRSSGVSTQTLRSCEAAALGGAASEIHCGYIATFKQIFPCRAAGSFVQGLKTVDGSFAFRPRRVLKRIDDNFAMHSAVIVAPGARMRFQLAGGNSNRCSDHSCEGALPALCPFLAFWHSYIFNISRLQSACHGQFLQGDARQSW